ncbi:MAG: type II toxin-antitoxin system Phd/YefM family antitoxin [Gammaproteobacteria bacterium]
MNTVGAFEAKTHFSSLLKEVENGEQVLITKHGQPIAKLIPVQSTSRKSVKNAITKLKAFNQKHTLGDINWKSLRDQGRK